MANAARTLRHLVSDHALVRRAFPLKTMNDITAAIAAGETTHCGQLRFVVEAAMPLAMAWHDATPRQRAVQLFGTLGVWDTAENSGVLVYVLLADKAVEIVADRGIAARVPQQQWEGICRTMEAAFAQRRFAEGTIAGVKAISALLAEHFPYREGGSNELPDEPLVL